MNRRNFLKSSSIITLPLILKSCDWITESANFPISVNSDAATGHLIRESISFQKIKTPDVETLIVGGGIAGMSAAYQLRNQDFILCELSENLGGTSGVGSFKDISFAQGAHYDLAYPDFYGAEVLSLFEELNIITPLPWRNAWGFVDQQHIITHRRKNHCYIDGIHRKDVLPEGDLKNDFLELIRPNLGKMTLPTRFINTELQELNQIDFLSFLSLNLALTPEFIRGLDYHMKDDYGGEADKVSALAGIHYFMCRPYYNEIVELFSPPEGNYYFINKIKKRVPSDQLLTSHLVSQIKETSEGFEADVVDVKQKIVKSIKAKKIIYAGNKHALKYIYPQDYRLFERTIYSPWMVVNVLVNKDLPLPGYWQNEMLTSDRSLMGFVDSATQHTKPGQDRVLTVYYCLPPESREDLINAEKNKAIIAESTVKHISNYFDEDIMPKVKAVSIKVMGHAMPMPIKGYLFDDKNQYRKNKNIAYAGVDNSRLPLLYEAVDSGLVATKLLEN